MKLIPATSNHKEEILACLEEARTYFKKANIPQWQNPNYPCMFDVENDILNENAYVVIQQDHVVACAAILVEDDPNYQVIEGEWICNGTYGVIHRIAVLSEMKGKEIASYFFQYAKMLAKQAGCMSLRIDTHEQNHAMRRWIEKCGFQYCGIIHVEDGTPRMAFEFKL